MSTPEVRPSRQLPPRRPRPGVTTTRSTHTERTTRTKVVDGADHTENTTTNTHTTTHTKEELHVVGIALPYEELVRRREQMLPKISDYMLNYSQTVRDAFNSDGPFIRWRLQCGGFLVVCMRSRKVKRINKDKSVDDLFTSNAPPELWNRLVRELNLAAIKTGVLGPESLVPMPPAT